MPFNIQRSGALLCLMLAAFLQTARAQVDTSGQTVDPEKAQAIRTLLQLTRTADAFLLGFEEAMSAQPAAPDMPDAFMELFQAKVRERVPEFLEMLIPLYDRHLTREDVAELIELYRTTLGQRLIELQMALSVETARMGEQWGMRIAGEVLMELSNRPRR